MALMKYYNLESRVIQNVTDLEENLKKRILQEKSVRGLLAASPDAIVDIRSGNGDSQTEGQLIYDSGEFNILYKDTKVKKRNFMGRAALIGIELVVKGLPKDIIELQDYLDQSQFKVIEARTVTKGIFEFRTEPIIKERLDQYERHLHNLLQRIFPEVNLEISIYPLLGSDSEGKAAMEMCFSGELEQLFDVRKYILSTEAVTHRKYFNMINFLQ